MPTSVTASLSTCLLAEGLAEANNEPGFGADKSLHVHMCTGCLVLYLCQCYWGVCVHFICGGHLGQASATHLCQGLSLAGSRWTQQLRSPHYKRLGCLELRQSGERMRLGEGVSLFRIARSYWGRQGRGVCGGSNSMGGNWRNMGVIGYRIGRKKG